MVFLETKTLKFADGFSLLPVSAQQENSIPQSRLLFKGAETGLQVPGAVLEAAMEKDSGWLLFLTHDVPFEEGLEICLLNASFQLLDRATLAAPNVTAEFKDLVIAGERIVEFRFLGSRTWTLTLLESAGFRIPLISEPLGVVRPFGFSRRFVLSHSEG
jgi:hypothetical protein